MSVADSTPLPLVGIKPVSNALNQWVGLALQLPAAASPAVLQALLCCPEADALGNLDVFLPLPDPLAFDPALLDGLPLARLVLTVPAAALADGAVQQRCQALSERGLRLLV